MFSFNAGIAAAAALSLQFSAMPVCREAIAGVLVTVRRDSAGGAKPARSVASAVCALSRAERSA